jgi:minor extracellular serine protease Vpr
VNATSINGNYNLTSGTSFAAPHVSGTAAILLQKNPKLAPHEINSIISTTADPISDTYETPFPLEISGTGRLNVTKAFNANLIIIPNYVIFDLSPHTKTQTSLLHLIKVDFKINTDAVNFDYSLDGNNFYITAKISKEVIGEYQGMITIDDSIMQYHVPILVRIGTSSVGIITDDGKLDFGIYSNDIWTYAKITIYNDDYNLIDTVSITPTKNASVFIRESGQYWVEANIKAGNNTINAYSTIFVKSPAKDQIDFSIIGIPQRQLFVIIGIIAIIAIAWILVKK